MLNVEPRAFCKLERRARRFEFTGAGSSWIVKLQENNYDVKASGALTRCWYDVPPLSGTAVGRCGGWIWTPWVCDSKRLECRACSPRGDWTRRAPRVSTFHMFSMTVHAWESRRYASSLQDVRRILSSATSGHGDFALMLQIAVCTCWTVFDC